jgi:hypothetical protein
MKGERGVVRTSAAEDSAGRDTDAIVAESLGLDAIVEVVGCADQRRPVPIVAEAGIAFVTSTCLEQADCDAGVLREPGRDDATSGAAADDDVVEFSHCLAFCHRRTLTSLTDTACPDTDRSLTCCQKWHAAICPGSTSVRTGATLRHSSRASGQRVW